MSKSDRQRYGKLGGPLVVDRAFVRDMSFDHEQVHTQSWILVRGNQRTHLNSYDGNLGRKVTSEGLKWYEFDPEDKKMQKKLRDYEEVPVAQCPFATTANGDTTPEDIDGDGADEELEDEETLSEA